MCCRDWHLMPCTSLPNDTVPGIEVVRTSDSGDAAGELGAHALSGLTPPVLPPDPSLLLAALVAPCDTEILVAGGERERPAPAAPEQRLCSPRKGKQRRRRCRCVQQHSAGLVSCTALLAPDGTRVSGGTVRCEMLGALPVHQQAGRGLNLFGDQRRSRAKDSLPTRRPRCSQRTPRRQRGSLLRAGLRYPQCLRWQATSPGAGSASGRKGGLAGVRTVHAQWGKTGGEKVGKPVWQIDRPRACGTPRLAQPPSSPLSLRPRAGQHRAPRLRERRGSPRASRPK